MRAICLYTLFWTLDTDGKKLAICLSALSCTNITTNYEPLVWISENIKPKAALAFRVVTTATQAACLPPPQHSYRYTQTYARCVLDFAPCSTPSHALCECVMLPPHNLSARPANTYFSRLGLSRLPYRHTYIEHISTIWYDIRAFWLNVFFLWLYVCDLV